MVESLGKYLDNLAGAVTNRCSTFEKYSKNFTKLDNSIVTLTYTNKKWYSELQSLCKENVNLNNKVAMPDADGGRLQGTPLNSEFLGRGRGKYGVRGTYFCSHGFGIGKRHDSSNCHDKNTDHQNAET